MNHSLSQIPLYTGSYDELIQAIDHWIHGDPKNGPAHLVTLNPEIWVDSYHDPLLFHAISSATWITADGIGIVLGLRLCGRPSVPRRTGSDLTPHLLQSGRFSLYLLGGSEAIIQKTVSTIQEKYPGARIVGYRNGFFSLDLLDEIATDIQACDPDIVLVAMGSPRQDRVIQHLKSKLSRGVLIGIGGVFDIIAGAIPRSPKWMQRFGIEWIWRLTLQPARIKRLVRMLPRFIWKISVHK